MGYPNDSNQANLYTAEGYNNAYELRPGVCILPLAEDPPSLEDGLESWSPVVVLQLHAPYRIRKVIHLSEKKNNPPPIPSSADQGSFIFIGGSVSIQNTLNTTFCNFDWSVGCVYTFVENCVSREQDGYVLGSSPFTWASDAENKMSGYSAPTVGAVAHSGVDVLVGYRQGLQIVGNLVTGNLQERWGYNTPCYYPGTLVYSELVNGGTPIVPSTIPG
jgi:hypothetical protein